MAIVENRYYDRLTGRLKRDPSGVVATRYLLRDDPEARALPHVAKAAAAEEASILRVYISSKLRELDLGRLRQVADILDIQLPHYPREPIGKPALVETRKDAP